MDRSGRKLLIMADSRVNFSSIIEDIKFRNPIEDVISSFVTLKKTGNTLKGLCPFHSERTPSFVVYPQTRSYYCFGCGAAGDVISFVMKSENLDYIDAVRALAERSGITLPESNSGVTKGTGRQRVLEINLEAAKFFRAALFDQSMGVRGREYVEKRQIPAAIVKHFGLGYAPDSFNALHNYLRQKGVTDEEMQDAFLCKKSEKTSKYYDIFRDRLIFPIIDNSGNVIAFGGRILDSEKSPQKYLNTSDTPAFKKSKSLFALNFARHHCAERLIICEGYMDVIAMHAAGVENSVATLGTAITADHARLLKRYTKKVILAYDSDGPGQEATERAMRVLSEVDLESSILVINGAKDPDEFITRYGPEKFQKLVEDSHSRFEFRLQKAVQNRDMNNPEDKIKAIAEVCDFISGISSKVEREIYISQTAKSFGVSEENVSSDVMKVIARKRKNDTKKKRETFVTEKRGFGDRVNRDYAKFPKLAKQEETVIGMVLFKPEYISQPVDGEKLSSADFKSELCRRIFDFSAAKSLEEGFDISLLHQEFTDEETNRAYGLMTERMLLNDNSPDTFIKNVRELRSARKRTELAANEAGVESILDILNSKKEQ